ncbi:hypothetical protein SAMN06295888_13615 [Desulfonatronum zhilinae]|nr:hypothetical protein SAMN06295888_13615 [Desulfonatronum zhilinae]
MLNVKITVNGVSARIPYDQIDNLVYSIPDESRHNDVIAELARSTHPHVRMAVASRDTLDRKIVSILVEDTQIDVLRNLVSNSRARMFITETCLLRLIKTEDHDILVTVAENLDSFPHCDEDVLAEKLARMDNPVIRGILAENVSVSRQVLEQLSHDEDEDIAEKAADSLERALEEESDEEEEELEDDEDD